MTAHPAEARKRPWYAKRERFETPLARRLQTPAWRRAFLVAVPLVVVAYPTIVLLLGDGSVTAYLTAVMGWLLVTVVLLSFSNMAIGGLTTIDPRHLDEREREQRAVVMGRARVVSTAAVFVPVLIAPQLAEAGNAIAVLALVQTVWFLHCFAPSVLVLWAQRDRAAERDPDALTRSAPETEAPA